jgi:hypothetical protein
MFRVPPEGLPTIERLHTGEKMDVATWQWPGDPRVFLVPVEMFQNMALAGLIRDIIASTGQMYRDQHYPQDLMVRSSLRRIADSIGLSINGNVGKNIDDCLAFARMYTIKNQDIITKLKKDGTVASKDSRTYGYIDMVSRAVMRNGRVIPRNKQWYEITLSQMYASGLRMLPSAPLPVAALDAAHAAPRRIIPTIKNLAYHLAGRVPQAKIRLLLPTIRDIAGLAERKDGRTDKTRRTIESALERLNPVMVANFAYDKDGYTIILAGSPEIKHKPECIVTQ